MTGYYRHGVASPRVASINDSYLPRVICGLVRPHIRVRANRAKSLKQGRKRKPPLGVWHSHESIPPARQIEGHRPPPMDLALPRQILSGSALHDLSFKAAGPLRALRQTGPTCSSVACAWHDRAGDSPDPCLPALAGQRIHHRPLVVLVLYMLRRQKPDLLLGRHHLKQTVCLSYSPRERRFVSA